MKNIHEYDRKMLDEYKKSKEKVATLKQILESGKADMEFMATTYEQQEEKELKTTINTMKTQVADFDVQLANAQKQAEEEAKRLEQTQQMEANSQMQNRKTNRRSHRQTDHRQMMIVKVKRKNHGAEAGKTIEAG